MQKRPEGAFAFACLLLLTGSTVRKLNCETLLGLWGALADLLWAYAVTVGTHNVCILIVTTPYYETR